MLRTRSYKRWGTRTEYSSVEEFIQPKQPVVHSIKHRGVPIDILTHDRSSNTTLVVFHASLSRRAKTLPQLQGRKLAADTGCNLISVSDPTLVDTELDLGWYLGNRRTGPLPPVLAPIIQTAIARLGGESNSSRWSVRRGICGHPVRSVFPRFDCFSH